jgi:hypothetical protein
MKILILFISFISFIFAEGVHVEQFIAKEEMPYIILEWILTEIVLFSIFGYLIFIVYKKIKKDFNIKNTNS